MSNKARLAAVLWLSGFVAGVVLVGRWRRVGETQLERSTPDLIADDAPTASGTKAQRAVKGLAGPIVAGAKADLQAFRNAASKASHRSTSTIDEPDTPQAN
jgi:hypothetical protein